MLQITITLWPVDDDDNRPRELDLHKYFTANPYIISLHHQWWLLFWGQGLISIDNFVCAKNVE
jgi:hypothetical protein